MDTSIINNIKVKPVVQTGGEKPERIRGGDLFSEYCNIAIIGPKRHGKSTLIYNIAEHVCYKNNVLIFSPTVYNDPTYKKMIEMLTKKKKCNVLAYDHFYDSETGLNRIAELKELLTEKNKEKEIVKKIEKLEERLPICNFGQPPKKVEEVVKEIEKKEPKPKGPLTAEYVIIYDDLGNDLRDASLYQFLIKNYHYKTKNILAVHNSTNLLPGAWNNLNYLLCLGNIPEEKFLTIQGNADIQYKGENKNNRILYDVYKEATEKQYDFLYINRDTGELRHNFNKRINVS